MGMGFNHMTTTAIEKIERFFVKILEGMKLLNMLIFEDIYYFVVLGNELFSVNGCLSGVCMVYKNV